MPTTLLIWLLGSAIVLLGVRFLFFQGACALADVQPPLTKALSISTAMTLVLFGLIAAATVLLAQIFPFVKPTEPTLGASLPVLGVTLVALALLSWPIYLVTLPTTTRKAVQIAGWEQALLALLYGLLVTLFFVGLALYQLFTYKPV